jgi:3-phosphoshikimate 1-carboxyvinyltransferase
VNRRVENIRPATGPLRGEVTVPADKSITHRALMVAAVCDAPVVVHRPLWAGDTRSTARCLRAAGVRIESAVVGRGGGGQQGDVVVRGVGLDGLQAPQAPMDAGNSGTTVRLLAGLLAGGSGRFVLDGDNSLRRRPMDRIVAPLRAMGVTVEASDGQYLPLRIDGGRVLATTYELPVASAQVKSCVLLAGLHAAGRTAVVERVPSRDHTERMLRQAGADVSVEGGVVSLCGRPQLQLDELSVPGDPSSAAFVVAAAALIPGSELVVREVGLNPTRMGFFEVLRRMGGDVTWGVEEGQGEPRGTLVVRQAPLHGVHVSPEEAPLLIDEVPLVALLATAAEGETIVEGVAELRVKESDRLAAVGDIITRLGGRIDVADDSLRVRPGRLHGGVVDSRGDHRLAMLAAVAGLVSENGVGVEGFEAAAVSFPGFLQALMEVLR